MNTKIDYQVNEKETVYYLIKIVTSIALYFLIFNFIVDLFSSYEPDKVSVYILLFYVVLIFIFLFFRFGILIGHLKGNAIRVNQNQFPDIYNVVVNQSELLGLRNVPDVYILQSGGALNAFAARFMGNNYVVLYSEVVEAAYEQDKNLLEFIIGHELGHIKRNHMIKNLLLFPAWLIPFLGAAYSRACEYTCDNIGFALAPNGLKGGLLVLASGRTIYKKVNVDEYLVQGKEAGGFWKWFAEKVSSHPNLSKRIAKFENEQAIKAVKAIESQPERKESDHSKFMPK